jgi:transcriptional regulator with XRE-family HTH domain
MNTLATRIKERLDTLGKTQAGLARYCKVQRPSVSKWLSGSTKTLQGQNLLRAAEYLECDAEWLADGKGFWNKNFHNGIRQEKGSEQYNIVALNDEQLVESTINTYDVAPSISNINYTEEQYRRLFSSKDPEFIKITNIKVDNMSGTLETGDLVFIDTSIKQ